MTVLGKPKKRTRRYLRCALVIGIAAVVLAGSVLVSSEPGAAMRAASRQYEFDFSAWTVDALFSKLMGASLKAERFFSRPQQAEIVDAYLAQVVAVARLNMELDMAVAAPDLGADAKAETALKDELDEADTYLQKLAYLTEAVLQSQTEASLAELGFGLAGQVLPPVLYRVSELPLNLIVSPREEIRSLFQVSLVPGMDSVEKDTLETEIFTQYQHSALVEPIGGLSAYPTMVMQTADFNWLTEVVAHEWMHNYLIFRPLGLAYESSAEMRTVNETVASLSGKEIGLQLVSTYHPDRLPPDDSFSYRQSLPLVSVEPYRFDFRAEMRETRERVDSLLSAEKVEEAEAYMEMRRLFFWENGYFIRKLNQAYFAFYGAYNDTPGGGASGSDPVGPAVRALRSQTPDLKSFINRIAWVNTYADLQEMLTISPRK